MCRYTTRKEVFSKVKYENWDTEKSQKNWFIIADNVAHGQILNVLWRRCIRNERWLTYKQADKTLYAMYMKQLCHQSKSTFVSVQTLNVKNLYLWYMTGV